MRRFDGVIGSYYGPALFLGADDPIHQSVDAKHDAAQEEAAKGAVVTLTNSIIAAL